MEGLLIYLYAVRRTVSWFVRSPGSETQLWAFESREKVVRRRMSHSDDGQSKRRVKYVVSLPWRQPFALLWLPEAAPAHSFNIYRFLHFSQPNLDERMISHWRPNVASIRSYRGPHSTESLSTLSNHTKCGTGLPESNEDEASRFRLLEAWIYLPRWMPLASWSSVAYVEMSIPQICIG